MTVATDAVEIMGNATTEITADAADDDDGYVPTCEELDESYCSRFGGEDMSECCMLDCASELQALVTCTVLKTTGEDRSMCSIPDCPTMAPAVEETTGDKEVASSASAVSKMFALVASVFAFVML